MAVGNYDGTQPLPPERRFADPLAGLVTGEAAPGMSPLGAFADEDTVGHIAQPVAADPEAARAFSELLGEDEPEPRSFGAPVSAQSAVPGRPRGPVPGMMAMPPRQHPAQRIRQALHTESHVTRNAQGISAAAALMIVIGVIALVVLLGIIQGVTER